MRSNLKGSLSLHTSQVAHQPGAYTGFYGMRRLAVFLHPPLGGMLVHRRITPSITYAGTNIFTWVERGTVSVKCLAQELNVTKRTFLTQHNVLGQGSNPDRLIRRRAQ